jgi:hypothetical protein
MQKIDHIERILHLTGIVNSCVSALARPVRLGHAIDQVQTDAERGPRSSCPRQYCSRSRTRHYLVVLCREA